MTNDKHTISVSLQFLIQASPDQIAAGTKIPLGSNTVVIRDMTQIRADGKDTFATGRIISIDGQCELIIEKVGQQPITP